MNGLHLKLAIALNHFLIKFGDRLNGHQQSHLQMYLNGKIYRFA
ncbi:hypothetical protein EV682_12620 [Iodobacter fluviatilis]|uniref:Uncharacterized protein n=1 Tax=Iodobacter fluviatilis TaxID=537 RepID=A0A377Q5T6_9NEIS|nr:hypothetical protein EV682_12620 [Iodobacter fluviatilis]STQ90167.1 Uncharacterised protein [Iodobacter fluviatilis]